MRYIIHIHKRTKKSRKYTIIVFIIGKKVYVIKIKKTMQTYLNGIIKSTSIEVDCQISRAAGRWICVQHNKLWVCYCHVVLSFICTTGPVYRCHIFCCIYLYFRTCMAAIYVRAKKYKNAKFHNLWASGSTFQPRLSICWSILVYIQYTTKSLNASSNISQYS